MGYNELIDGNKKFISEVFSPKKKEFDELQKGQSPHTLIISCCDSRVAPEMICYCGPGEIFVHRNIGNIVAPGDWNLATVLEYAIAHLKVGAVAVMGHENCGAMKALGTGHGATDVYIPGWLRHAYPALEKVSTQKPASSDPSAMKQWLHELEVENIRLQLQHLKTYPIVESAIADKKIEIFGLYYLMTTGEIEKIQ